MPKSTQSAIRVTRLDAITTPDGKPGKPAKPAPRVNVVDATPNKPATPPAATAIVKTDAARANTVCGWKTGGDEMLVLVGEPFSVANPPTGCRIVPFCNWKSHRGYRVYTDGGKTVRFAVVFPDGVSCVFPNRLSANTAMFNNVNGVPTHIDHDAAKRAAASAKRAATIAAKRAAKSATKPATAETVAPVTEPTPAPAETVSA